MEDEVKIVESPRKFETVGEEVRFNLLKDIQKKLQVRKVWSSDNSLTEQELLDNRACDIAKEIISILML